MNNNKLRSIVAIGFLILTLGGCSTLESVPINRSKPEGLRSQLAVGETVSVWLNSGDQRKFRIRALETDAVVGRDVRIPYTDIYRVEVKTVDYEGTVKTALAATALVVVYIAAAIADDGLYYEFAP